MFDVLIVNGKVIVEKEEKMLSIGIKDGKIAALLSPDISMSAKQTLDCKGKYILPGAIDSHSHVTFCGGMFRDGSKSAVAGGITTIVEMPISAVLPSVLTPKIFEKRIEDGETQCVGDFALWAGAQPGSYEHIGELKTLGAAAFKVFMSYAGEDYKYFDDYSLHQLMKVIGVKGGVVGIHAENESLCSGYSDYYRSIGCKAEIYSESRPVFAETEAVMRACLLARDTGCKTHICHVSNSQTADVILAAKTRGAFISYETCPHYLVLTKEDIKTYGVYAKCNPPMRSKEEQKRLWRLLKDGQIDCIGTDHAAYSEEMKETGDFWTAPGGFPGNDLMVPVVLDGVSKQGLSWTEAAAVLSQKPAQIFGLSHRKGKIAIGMDADFMVINPDCSWNFHSYDAFYDEKSAQYPYENRQFQNKVEMTLVRGKVVYQDGRIMAEDGYGTFIKSI